MSNDPCANGKFQSPIDIKSSGTVKCGALCDLTFYYRTSKANMVNIGKNILLINHTYDVRTDQAIETHSKIKQNAIKTDKLLSILRSLNLSTSLIHFFLNICSVLKDIFLSNTSLGISIKIFFISKFYIKKKGRLKMSHLYF